MRQASAEKATVGQPGARVNIFFGGFGMSVVLQNNNAFAPPGYLVLLRAVPIG